MCGGGRGLLAQLKREILIAPGRAAHGNQCLICWLVDKGFNAGTCQHPPAVLIVLILPSFRLVLVFSCVCVCVLVNLLKISELP